MEYFTKKMQQWTGEYKKIRVDALGYDEDKTGDLVEIETIDKREVIEELAVANF